MAGGVGLAVAAFAISLFSGFGRRRREREEAGRQREIAKAEATAEITILEDYLARYPAYAELAKASYEEQGKQQFRELMANFGELNVMAGATGQVGPGTSAAALAGQAKGKVVTLAGEDLSLEGGEGLYGAGYDVLAGQLDAERLAAEQQLDVWQEVLEGLTAEPAGPAGEQYEDENGQTEPVYGDEVEPGPDAMTEEEKEEWH